MPRGAVAVVVGFQEEDALFFDPFTGSQMMRAFSADPSGTTCLTVAAQPFRCGGSTRRRLTPAATPAGMGSATAWTCALGACWLSTCCRFLMQSSFVSHARIEISRPALDALLAAVREEPG